MNEDFVKKFLEGDTPTIQGIYSSSFKKVLYYILKRDGTKKDAEDIFHNALIILFVKLKENSKSILLFENYLFTICKNQWKRKNSKNRVTNSDTITLVSDEINVAAFFVEQKRWELYKEKFKLISEQCQNILKLLFKKTPYKEIAKNYNYASENVARQRAFKCKMRLAQLIQKDNRFKELNQDS